MTTRKHTMLREPGLFAPLFAASLLFSSSAGAAELLLSGERSSNKLTLRWNGALGVKLQQSVNPASSQWQDVPNSDGVSSMQVPMTNAMAFFRLTDEGTSHDADGDGLDDFIETNGWTVTVDTSGYNDPRIVELRHVTSDPGLEDTDCDGLTDPQEWLFDTDPRAADTDRDGLSDYDEVFIWHTSPTCVDTDGDARGPNHDLPPNSALFDGNEVRVLRTSPTLDDTDGDGRTDYEEYDQPGRNLLVAEVPKLDLQLVDAVDIRLDVQYAEESGNTFQYGTELSESTTTSRSFYNENSMQASLTLGVEHTFGIFNSGWKANVQASIGYGHVWSTTDETATMAENSYSQYKTDSRTRTETAASGSMSGGIRLVNTGPITYTITDLGLTVRYWMPGTVGTNGEFRTLATLVPVLGANGVTLAPGDSTPVLQVQATGLNASRVKEFMARPNSLYLEPAYYELENAQGLNFDYLEEVTRWRTARVEIDYGNGSNEEYRVATNAGRNEDGSYAGVTLGNVMSNILHIPFQTVPRQTLQPTNATNERVLFSVRDVVTASTTNGFWIVSRSGDGTPPVHPNFEDLVLRAGDQVLLMFSKDEDGDGLFAAEEQHYRTDDTADSDSDSDGLPDVFEARLGWDVVLPTQSYHVYSDPAQADQDGDNLSDFQEFQLGTDPTNPDTDADGLPDGLDPHPLVPAKVLRVKANAAPGGTGATWTNALNDLQAALALARAGLATTGNPSDDVAEIWVAAGIYKPTITTNRWVCFELVNNTALYGGFAGGETRLSQRNPDPLFNGTVLSGDLKNNDASTYGENTNSFAENSYLVCYAGDEVGPGTVLDGFTITGGNANGVDPYYNGAGILAYGGNPRLRNLLFRANHAAREGGGLYLEGATPPSGETEFVVSDCLFLQNSADWSGGGVRFHGPAGTSLVLTNCQFVQNETRIYRAGYSDGGGGLFAAGYSPTEITVENCVFSLNTSVGHGGGILLEDFATARISQCEFRANTAKDGGGLSALCWDPGALTVEAVQNVFWGNTASAYTGGGIYMVTQGGRLYVLDSSFGRNTCTGASGGAIFLSAVTNTPAQGLVENCILWDNTPAPNIAVVSGSLMRVRTSCLPAPEANAYPGAGNIIADPKFVDGIGGDLRLQPGSPCIDKGNNYIDYYPTVPGFQPLPATDLDGHWRVMDGNHDGTATVDLGAYEFQGQ